MAKKATKPKTDPGRKFADRIKSLRRVKASELIANEHNWRTHPAEQKHAMLGVLEEIGWASAVIARETKAGELEIIDGHLRAGIEPDEMVPVLVTDLSEAEAQKLLVVLDPIGDLAGGDKEKLRTLLDEVQFANEDLAQLCTQLAEDHGIIELAGEESSSSEGSGAGVGDSAAEPYMLLVDCRDKETFKELRKEMTDRGYECWEAE